MNRTFSVKTVFALILLSIVLGAGIGYAVSNPASQLTISGGIYPGAPSYTIWAEGSTYFAKDSNGNIVSSGTDVGALINSIKTGLPAYGGEIHIVAGVYNQYTTILLGLSEENTTISGEGYKTSTRFMVKSDIYAINITGYNSTTLINHVYLKNLKIKAEVGVSSTKPAIFLKFVGGSKFENIAIDKMGYGFYAVTPSVPNLISQCIFETVSLFQIVKSGLVLQDSYDCRLSNVYVLDLAGSYLSSEAGIKTIHSYGGDVIDSCLVLNGAGHGVTISESATWTTLSNVVSDNNDGHQIYLSYSSGTQLSNSWASTSQGANTYGIIVDASNDTIINNCQVRTNAAHGIYIFNSTGAAISNCMSMANGQVNQGFGIAISYSTGTIVSSCITTNRIHIGFNSTAQQVGVNEDVYSDYSNIYGVDARGNLVDGIIINGANTEVHLSWDGGSYVP